MAISLSVLRESEFLKITFDALDLDGNGTLDGDEIREYVDNKIAARSLRILGLMPCLFGALSAPKSCACARLLRPVGLISRAPPFASDAPY